MTVDYVFGNGGYTLTTEQLVQLQDDLDAIGKLTPEQLAQAGQGATLYQHLLSYISNGNEPIPGVNFNVWQWIQGAKTVNEGDVGAGALIRDYTKEIYFERYGTILDDGVLNAASNNIAIALARSIIKQNGLLPDIEGIGAADAGSIAAGVFTQLGDPAVFSPWAGTMFFPILGEPNFYEQWMLNMGTLTGTVQNPDLAPVAPLTLAETFKSIEGTYDLVAGLEAFDALPVDHFLDSLLADFNAPVADPEEMTTLAVETVEFFLNAYGLAIGQVHNIGQGTPFNATLESLSTAPAYRAGTLGNDNLSYVFGSSQTMVVNAGPGDDVIKINYSAGAAIPGGGVSFGPIIGGLIDGGSGFNTVDYSNVSEALMFILEKPDTSYFGYRFEETSSNQNGSEFLYDIQNIVGSSGIDTLDVIAFSSLAISYDIDTIYGAYIGIKDDGQDVDVRAYEMDVLKLAGHDHIKVASGMDVRAQGVNFDNHLIAGTYNSGGVDAYGCSYALSGTTLTVANAATGDVLTINNFHNGDFGVTVAGPGYYVVQQGDTWATIVSHTAFRNAPSFLNATVLQNINAALGVTSLTPGALVYVPVNVSTVEGSGVSYATPGSSTFPRYTFVYDALGGGGAAVGNYYAVGGKLDGSNTGALVIDRANGDGSFPTFDAGTYSTMQHTSTDAVNVFLTTSNGLALGTLSLPVSGNPTLTLLTASQSNGMVIPLASLTGAHLTAQAGDTTPKGAILNYIHQLGNITYTEAQLNAANFAYLNPPATAHTQTGSTSVVNGHAQDQFTNPTPGAVITGLSSATISGTQYSSVDNVIATVTVGSVNLSQDTITNVQTLRMNLTGFSPVTVTMTHEQLAGFTGYNGAKGITGGGTLVLSNGGTLDLNSSTIDQGYNYNLAATGWEGTTLIGNGQNNQSLTASLYGNDKLTAGSGINDVLTAGIGVDRLTGSNNGKTSFYAINGLASGSSVTGYGIGNTLTAGGDISGATVSGVQSLIADKITLTDAQFQGFTTFGVRTSGIGLINAATGGNYRLDATSSRFNMTALSNNGTTLEEDNAQGVTLTASYAGNDTLKAINGRNVVLRVQGNSTGNDTLYSTGGTLNTLDVRGSTGANILNAAGDSADTIYAGNGNNTLYGSASSVYIYGGAGTNTIYLQAGYEQVTGGAGDDIIHVGGLMTAGSSITGGTGNNTLIVDAASGSDISNAALTNVNTLKVSGPSSVTLTLAQFAAFTTFVNTNSNPVTLNFTTTGAHSIDGKTFEGAFIIPGFDGHIENIIGSNHDDILTGDAGSNTINGKAGNDALNGGAGNDTYVFNIGDGADTIIDSSGSDSISFGPGVTIATLSAVRSVANSNDLIISYGTFDTITLHDWYVDSSVQTIHLSDQSVLNFSDMRNAGGSVLQKFSGLAAGEIEEDFNYSGVGTAGILISETINYANGQSQKKLFTGLPIGETEEDFSYSGANATGTLLSKVTEFSDGSSVQTLYSGLDASVVSQTNYYSGVALGGVLVKQVTNYTAGNSVVELFNPSTTVSENFLYYTGPDGTGTLTSATLNLTAGGSRQVLYTGLAADEKSEVYVYDGANLSGTLTRHVVNYLDGHSTVMVFNPSATISQKTLFRYTDESGTGVLQSQVIDYTNGTSKQITYTGLPTGVTQVTSAYSGLDLSGDLTKQITNFAVGTSTVKLFNVSDTVATNTKYYSGLDGSGTFLSQTLNFVAGGSKQLVFSGLPSGESEENLYYSGADLTGSLTRKIVNYTAGNSIRMLYNPSATVSLRTDYYSGSDATGTLLSQTLNLTSGGSKQVLYSDLPTEVTETDSYYSGSDLTGALTKVVTNFTAGNSTVKLYNPSSTVLTNTRYYTGLDGAGTLLSETINLTAGGSKQVLYLAGGIQEVLVYSGADLTGTLTTNTFTGTSGNDIFATTTGAETLVGNGGYDTYQFGRGSGFDVIRNGLSTNTTATGELDLGADIATNQIWFEKKGNNLQVDILGTQDHMTISGWYSNAYSQVQEIKSGDGYMVDSQIAQLVQAMASYSSSHSGFNPTTATQMPTDISLQNALAAAWHS